MGSRLRNIETFAIAVRTGEIFIYRYHGNSIEKVMEAEPVPGLLYDVSWSLDGKCLALATGYGLDVFDRGKRKVIESNIGASYLESAVVDWCSDGVRIAIGGKNFLILAEFRNGELREVWAMNKSDFERALGIEIAFWYTLSIVCTNGKLYAAGAFGRTQYGPRPMLIVAEVSKEKKFRIYTYREI